MFCSSFIPKASPVLRISPRHLCSGATRAALKPFYFAVHPDLFGQHPQQRVVNEDSLKKLNSYLESLEERTPANPTHLTFYLKDAATSCGQGSESAFKTVQFLLSSHDLSFTVSQILKTCGMFEDLLPGTCLSDDKAKQEGKKFQKKTTTFYSSLRSYPYHGRLKYSHQNDKYPPSTLEDFLGKHIESAREKLENSAARLRENEKLSELICRGLNLKELVSQSKWSLAAQQGSLRTLLQLCARRESEFGQLEGRTVVFANYTDVDPLGRVKLAVQDVPEVWLSLINSLADYDVLVSQVPFWERRVMKMLGDIRIRYDGSSLTATVADYLSHLQRITTTLTKGRSHRSYWEFIKIGDVKGLEGRILSPVDSLSLSPEGMFRIPSSTPIEVLLDFLCKNKQKAWELQREKNRNGALEAQAINKCITKLGLQSLQKDDSVCPVQMTKCCERLVGQCSSDLQQTQLIVSTFYSVTTDGFIYIPWNWA